MAALVVPSMDEEPWPSLGKGICDLLREGSIYGPGSLKGLPYVVDPDFEAWLYRAYEVYPRGHQWEGRRRFKRCGMSIRKGVAKTERLAQIAYAELHPDGPVRFDGWDASGQPVGRPVRDPYMPLLAFSVEQSEELAFGALYVICTEGPDADLFDSTDGRIIRLGPTGAADGKAVALSNSPGSRDGARTTWQGFDEPHRLFMPRAKAAHETMVANLEKRPLEDPWGCYVGTAGELGEGSIAEGLHAEAESIARGEIDDPQLFYLHRDAGQVHDGDPDKAGHDLSTIEGRVAAIREASGPTPEFAPGQFHSIARQWDRPSADKRYLQRVWLNLWIKSGAQAFDVRRWSELRCPDPIPRGAFVTAGFDGARFRDSTGLVITDIATGRQQLWATWERPLDLPEDALWEVPEAEVTASVEDLVSTMDLWKCYADPPHWTETVGSWAGRWPDQFEEWWTARPSPMSKAIRAFDQGVKSRAVTHVYRTDAAGNVDPRDEAFDRHVGNAGRKDVNLWDDDGQRMFVLAKIHPDRKFDNAMAGCLSWTAYLDAVKTGAKPRRRRRVVPRRLDKPLARL